MEISDNFPEHLNKKAEKIDIRDLVLANAPDNAGTSRGYFAVPKVMDGD